MAACSGVPQEEPDVLRVEEVVTNETKEDPDQQVAIDAIDSLKPEEIPEDFRQKLKDAYRCKKAKSLRILLTGRTGTGKSSLINMIIGLEICEKGSDIILKSVAKEGKRIAEPCTAKVTEYAFKKGKTTVIVWDSPGLQDGTGNQEEYLRQMSMKCTNRDLTIYCIRITEGRFLSGRDNTDVLAMEKLTKKFGVSFWENTIIVLTFANVLEALNEWEDMSNEKKIDAFWDDIREWDNQIRRILSKDIHVPQEIVKHIRIAPAGHFKKPNLPSHDYWFSALWFQCLAAIPDPEKQVALVKMSVARFKRPKDVTDKDLMQPPHKQPIVSIREERNVELVAGTRTGRVALGAIKGFQFGAWLLPVGIVTMPLGAVIGAIAGYNGVRGTSTLNIP